MLRSRKLTGSLYIGIGLLSAVIGISSSHDGLAAVGAVFGGIGAALLASAAKQAPKRPGIRGNARAHRHRERVRL